MAKEPKMMVSGAQANFLKAMLESAPKKFGEPQPNTATKESTTEIEKITKNLQDKWIRSK